MTLLAVLHESHEFRASLQLRYFKFSNIGFSRGGQVYRIFANALLQQRFAAVKLHVDRSVAMLCKRHGLSNLPDCESGLADQPFPSAITNIIDAVEYIASTLVLTHHFI